MVAQWAMRQMRGFRPGVWSEGLAPCRRVRTLESPPAPSMAHLPRAALRPAALRALRPLALRQGTTPGLSPPVERPGPVTAAIGATAQEAR
eukprot:12561585-Alexandrium_andersonii.AAC.1